MFLCSLSLLIIETETTRIFSWISVIFATFIAATIIIVVIITCITIVVNKYGRIWSYMVVYGRI